MHTTTLTKAHRLTPNRFTRSTSGGFPVGFTLVELLGVISIIALLVSILLPALNKARAQAKAVVCAAQMRQYTLAVVYYVDDNDNFFPMYAHELNYTSGNTNYEYIWFNAIAPYMDGEKIPPGAPVNEKRAIDSRNHNMEVRDCPEKKSYIGIHYGAYANNNVDAPWLICGPTYGNSFKWDAIRGPSEWIAFLDVYGLEETDSEGWGMYSPNYHRFDWDYDGDGIFDSHEGAGWGVIPYNFAQPKIHNKAMNVGMCDGHVQRMSFNEFQNPDNRLWDGRPGI